MSLQRLRHDFQFALLTLFGAIAVLGILPFAVYRLVHGEWLAGAVDLGIVLSIALAVANVWRGGSQTLSAVFVVLSTTAGCLWVAILLGLPGLLWMYPVLVSHYILLERRWAVVVSALAIAFLLWHGGPFESGLQQAMFLVSGGVTALFAFIFAQRTDRQHAQLEQLALHDALTGAGNRRALDREMRITVASRARGKHGQGLLLLDLDHFKRVNDRDGHEAGDAALARFADIVCRNSRVDDRLFRMGGEEFVLLAATGDAEALRTCGEYLRQRVAGELHAGDGPITVSVGGAMLRDKEPPQDWLARADAALYEAKRTGRNRVVIAGDGEPERPPPHGR